MSPLSFFLIAFIVFFLFGMPIAASMICSTFIYCISARMDLAFLGIQMFTGLNNFVLIAIPLFILTAEVMNRTSVADRIFKFCGAVVGYIPGGMGHVNIATSIIFAGMSGSAVADAGGIGHLSYRAMVDNGFDEEFSACVTIASSTIGPIIPPSIPAVVYAMVANVSVGRLLFGGIIPGFLMGFILIAFVYIYSIKRKYSKMQWIGWKQYIKGVFASFISCILPLLTPCILLGGIYLGVVTTTEASAIAVLYACILGFVLYRSMNINGFIESLKSVFKTSGTVLLVIPAAKIFSFVMTKENLQNKIYRFVASFAGDSKVLIALCIVILFLILGCLSDPNVNIMVFVPMILPLIKAGGFDPIHMGICIIVVAMIGNITPPVGVVLMTVCSLEKLSMEKVCKALWPFILLLILFVILLLIFPQIVVYLPNIMFK